MSGGNQSGGDGDNPLVSARFHEKTELQNLGQRFSNYVQVMRLRREKLMNDETIHSDERKWSDQLEHQRSMYEQQLSELSSQLQLSQHEKNELQAAQSKYEALSSEFEGRFLSLNEGVLKQNNEITKLQVSLSNKELELQQAQAQLTGPRTELNMCKLERDDLKKRFAEMERRFQTEEKAKCEFQQQLTDFHTRCSHEMMMYQQEIDHLRERLEQSRHLIIELEETARKSGQKDCDVAEMMRKAREASEIELRRYMDEVEAKHNLNLSELQMRMEADTSKLENVLEENRQLQAEMNNVKSELHFTQSKLTSAESSYKVAQTSLESERKTFEAQLRKLDRKQQETQDLLLIKIKELAAIQEGSVPLQTEIDQLKNLIEEEEKRLKLDGRNTISITEGQVNGQIYNVNEQVNHKQDGEMGLLQRQFVSAPTSSTALNSGTNGNQFSAATRLTSHVPVATQGFMRGPPGVSGMNLFEAPLAASTPNLNMNNKNDQSPGSVSSSLFDFNTGDDGADEDNRDARIRRSLDSPGLNHLPPRPHNPVPPKMLPRRPASAGMSRYVAADAGEGRDYFDAMFNDLRKDTMYTKVTEDKVGTDTTRVTSTHHDLVNSTASHEVKASKSGHLWYSGSTASATGNMKLVEIDEGGRFVRVHNASSNRAEDIGGCLLQQNVAGHPVAVFRFPPRTKLQPGHTATVWSASCMDGIHDPPSHYIWKKLDKWGTGPECTTILCKANGQAVAWMTSAPRISRVSRAYQYQPDTETNEASAVMSYPQTNQGTFKHVDRTFPDEELNYGRVALPYPSTYTAGPTLYSDAPSVPMPAPILKREPPSHAPRILPSRTGSAPLRKYVAPPSPMHHSSKVSPNTQPYPSESSSPSSHLNPPSSAPALGRNLTDELKVKCGVTSAPHLHSNKHMTTKSVTPKGSARLHLPGTFYSPGDQHRLGLNWVRSNHNLNFLPPMPRSFPSVTPIYTKRGEKNDVVLSH